MSPEWALPHRRLRCCRRYSLLELLLKSDTGCFSGDGSLFSSGDGGTGFCKCFLRCLELFGNLNAT